MFVRAQFEVALFDTSDEQLQGAQKDIEQKLTILEAEGLLGEAKTASQCMKNVSFFNNLQNAIDGAVYIQVRFEPCVTKNSACQGVCVLSFSVTFVASYRVYAL